MRPYVEATEILSGKAEKAAKLAKIEKKKTEKDFVQMNELLNKLKANRRSDLSTPKASSTLSDFDTKQKELEQELSDFKDEIEPFRKSSSELRTKVSEYEKAAKKNDIIGTDLGT